MFNNLIYLIFFNLYLDTTMGRSLDALLNFDLGEKNDNVDYINGVHVILLLYNFNVIL